MRSRCKAGTTPASLFHPFNPAILRASCTTSMAVEARRREAGDQAAGGGAARPGLCCFQVLFHASSQVRLSERNVVELVTKLQAAQLLGPDLLHSINGREYLTVEHLRAEVLSAVESSGGRIPVVRSR